MSDKIQHTRGPWQMWDEQGLEVFPSPSGTLVAHVTRGGNGEPPELGEANVRLIALAPTAPHDCDHDGCPGRENKRKLEAAAELAAVLRAVIDLHEPEHVSAMADESERDEWDEVCESASAAIARWEGR